MSHKTLVNGTVYEVGGGKTLIDGVAYSIDKGKTLIGGTAYEVGFGVPVSITLNFQGPSWASTSTQTYVIIDGATYKSNHQAYSTILTLAVPIGTVIHCHTVGDQCSDCDDWYGYIQVNSTKVASNKSTLDYDYTVTKNATITLYATEYNCCEDYEKYGEIRIIET